MKRLFQLGYEWAKAGYPWQKLPPGLRERHLRAAGEVD